MRDRRQGRRRVRRAMLRGVLLLTATSLAACTTPNDRVNTVEKADPIARPNVEEVRKVILNPPLDAATAVIDVYTARQDGALRVQVNLVNTTEFRQWFQYRFDWVDARGMQIADTQTPWLRANLLPGEMKSITGLSPNPHAVDWRLTIRGR